MNINHQFSIKYKSGGEIHNYKIHNYGGEMSSYFAKICV